MIGSDVARPASSEVHASALYEGSDEASFGDSCTCPKAACGFAVNPLEHVDCPHHGAGMPLHRSHWGSECPGVQITEPDGTQPEPAPAVLSADDDLMMKSKAELQEQASHMGLPTSGTKAQLVARIQEAG
jgi:hypothetical protein